MSSLLPQVDLGVTFILSFFFYFSLFSSFLIVLAISFFFLFFLSLFLIVATTYHKGQMISLTSKPQSRSMMWEFTRELDKEPLLN